MKKRVVLFASVVALMLFLIACGKQKEEVKETIASGVGRRHACRWVGVSFE